MRRNRAAGFARFDRLSVMMLLVDTFRDKATKPNHIDVMEEIVKKQRVGLNIPVSHFTSMLSWDKATIDELVQKAIDVAVKVGLRIDEDEGKVYLEEAESKGARVDWPAKAAMFTRDQIEETIAVMVKTVPVPNPYRELAKNDEGCQKTFWVGNGGNLIFDWENWTAKGPTRQDMVELCNWAQGCDQVGDFFPMMLKDVDQKLTPIYNYALMAKHCRKNVFHEQPTEPLHVVYLDKMSTVYHKHRGIKQPMPQWEYVNPPFRMGVRGIKTMLARVDTGICNTMGIGPMSVAGMSAPVTVAGLAVTALAELLAALTFFRVLRPGYGLMSNVCTGSLDLRTARVSYMGMHTHLCNLALCELLYRGVGVDAWPLTWYRDANEPGLQAAYEYAFNGLLFSCMNRGGAFAEIGGLCSGNMFSPHQALIDMEIIKEFSELTYGFEASDEALAIDEIVSARFEQGVHMSTEHTIEYMQDGIPFSSFFYRGMSGGAQHDKSHTQTAEIMERVAASVEASKAMGREVEPDNELGDEMYELVKEAAAELGVEAPPLP